MGLPDAIESVYPDTEVQLCIVHMVRNSLKFVSYKDRKKMATDLKTIYRAVTVEQAESALTTFGETWDNKVSDSFTVVALSLGSDYSVLCVF